MNKLFLMVVLFLSGCSTLQSKPTARELPPPQLLQDCPIPESTLRTNLELAEWAHALKYSLILCNNDKAALRSWADGASK